MTDDTPSVDEHPLEGGASALVAAMAPVKERLDMHYPDGKVGGFIDQSRWPRPSEVLAALRAAGYLLVSEAELAEALGEEPFFVRVEYADGGGAVAMQSPQEYAAAIFAALAKQQEDRER